MVRRVRRSAGVTLVEAMIAVGITMLIALAGTVLVLACLRMYQSGTSLTMAHERASLAMQLMTREIREAMNVDWPGPHAIVLTMPLKDSDGRYVVDPATKSLVPDQQIAFYYASDSGFPQANGTSLWKATRPVGAPYWERIEEICDGVVYLNFQYSPSLDMLELVRLDLRVRAKEGPKTYEQQVMEQVLVRNH
ncbi:MAG: PilW family protein [Armatimonadota bacterium]